MIILFVINTLSILYSFPLSDANPIPHAEPHLVSYSSDVTLNIFLSNIIFLDASKYIFIEKPFVISLLIDEQLSHFKKSNPSPYALYILLFTAAYK